MTGHTALSSRHLEIGEQMSYQNHRTECKVYFPIITIRQPFPPSIQS